MTGEQSNAREQGAMVPRLDVTCTARPDGIQLTVQGEIDSASAESFLADLQEAIIHTEGPIVVDLGSVTFIDSSGLNALITAQASADGRLHLGALHTTVRRVLQVTALLDHFPRSLGRGRDTALSVDSRQPATEGRNLP